MITSTKLALKYWTPFTNLTEKYLEWFSVVFANHWYVSAPLISMIKYNMMYRLLRQIIVKTAKVSNSMFAIKALMSMNLTLSSCRKLQSVNFTFMYLVPKWITSSIPTLIYAASAKQVLYAYIFQINTQKVQNEMCIWRKVTKPARQTFNSSF